MKLLGGIVPILCTYIPNPTDLSSPDISLSDIMWFTFVVWVICQGISSGSYQYLYNTSWESIQQLRYFGQTNIVLVNNLTDTTCENRSVNS